MIRTLASRNRIHTVGGDSGGGTSIATSWNISHLLAPLARHQESVREWWALATQPLHLHPRSMRNSSLSC
uniref:Uncharacterized protein n=1 Tax=Rhizophora mucronata TaxID=61149 RepID=A0A2P2NVB5_RHIMU